MPSPEAAALAEACRGRVAVLQLNGIGDALLSLPALRAMSEAARERAVLICSRSHYRLFFRGLRWSRVVLLEPHNHRHPKDFEAERVAEALGPCDALLPLVTWYGEAVDDLARLLGCPGMVGLPVDPSPDRAGPAHIVDRTLAATWPLLGAACLDPYVAPPDLDPATLDHARAWHSTLAPGTRVLGLHVDSMPEKSWPLREARRFAAEVLRQPDIHILVVGRPEADAFSGLPAGRITVADWPIGEQVASLTYADAVVAVDSCMMHVADFFRIPTVALFGPTDPAVWGCRFTRHVHLSNKGDVSAITASMAFDALDAILPAAAKNAA